MGGMIAQTMAIEHPDRVRSLTSIMSSTGDPRVGKPEPEALEVLLTVPPTEREALRRRRGADGRVGVEALRRRRAHPPAGRRGLRPQLLSGGGPRQLAAIYASGDRTTALARRRPALVIHGRDDTLITPSGGTATADAIPGAHLLLVADMGHDLPRRCGR